MPSLAIRNTGIRLAARVGLLGITFMGLAAQAEVTWNIVGTAPGEPDLVGTVTTPDIPVNCALVAPTECPIYGTLTLPTGSLGGGAARTFDLTVDPDQVLITITSSPLSAGDQFFLFNMNQYDIGCESQSALVLQCEDFFGGITVTYDLILTEQQPSVAIGNGNIVYTGQTVGPAEPPTLYSIGDSGPAGGIVFYVTDGGLHGLEAAPYDQGRAAWGCYGTEIGGTSEAIGAGAQNTRSILTACGDMIIAARATDNYSLNGFDDWHLPSKDELFLMFDNIGPGAASPNTNVGGFANEEGYYSSSELSDNWAYYNRNEGPHSSDGKNDALRVRAVRAF